MLSILRGQPVWWLSTVNDAATRKFPTGKTGFFGSRGDPEHWHAGTLGMTPAAFKHSLGETEPPAGLSTALAGLWWAGKDNWDKAHRLVMSDDGADCAWVHAYLHRVEGDLDNARYWYRQARRKSAEGDLAAEWAAIAEALLGSDASEPRSP
jgi:hypothetical protein